MNSNLNKNTKSRNLKKQIVSMGLHPEGGFVALPGGRTARFLYDKSGTIARNINRKGFVAWPVKD